VNKGAKMPKKGFLGVFRGLRDIPPKRA